MKDRVDSGEIRIVHCPTKEMLADYFTKPLQGMLFYKLRDYIMNVDPSSEFHSGHRSVLESNDFPVSNDLSNDVSGNNPESENGADGAEGNVSSYSYKDAVVGGERLVESIRSSNWADIAAVAAVTSK